MATGFYRNQGRWIGREKLKLYNLGLRLGSFNHTIVGDPLKYKYFVYLSNIDKCLLFACNIDEFLMFIDSFVENRLTILNHTVENKGILI